MKIETKSSFFVDSHKFVVSNRKLAGQSLFEILIAISIGALIVGVSVITISVTLKSDTKNTSASFAVPLARDLLEKVRSVSGGQWSDLYGLSPKGSAAQYKVVESGENLSIQSGAEIIMDNNINYTRSFSVENVGRDANGSVVASGGTEDPSTQKVTATVVYSDNAQIKVYEYFTRHKNDVSRFTDWSSSTSYSALNGIDVNTVGEIKLFQ